MNTWRKVKAVVILVLILAFSWFAHGEKMKTEIPEMSEKISQLKEVEKIFAYTVTIIPEGQKKICAEAAIREFDPQRKVSGIDPQKIYKLFGISKNDTAEGKGGEE